MDVCIFCHLPLSNEPTVKLTQKGCDSIQKANKARATEITVSPGQVVHEKCRREFTNSRSILQSKRKLSDQPDDYKLKALRSENEGFSYGDKCIFCECSDPYNSKKQDHKLITVRTIDFHTVSN